ncbi:MAG: hypothetical protein WBB45_05695 [Cyclobacteriaceae bacterium]
MTDELKLEQLFTETWQTLGRGVADAGHGFHWPVLGTSGPYGVEMRKVVLRKADRETGTLYCYSDERTGKVAQLRVESRTGWLFYDKKHKVQLRVKGISMAHHMDETAKEIWQNIEPEKRRDYTGPYAPGSPLKEYDANLAVPFRKDEHEPDRENTADGLENFVVVKTTVRELEYLKLQKEGHIRCLFTRNAPGEEWSQIWLAP